MSVATLRLLPAPDSAPPYDDELVGTPALAAVPLRLAPPPLRLVPPLARATPAPREDEDAWSRPRTPLAALSPAQTWAQAFLQRLLEVQTGARPVRQLARDTTPELYASLESWLVAHRREGGRLRSLRVQARAEGVAEASATLVRRTPQGPRVTALALRLEGLEGRWCCTDLEGL